MSASSVPVSTGGQRRAVSALARELAARLSSLFDADQAIAIRLNHAQRRLTDANDRLWSGLHPNAMGRIYDDAAPAGHSQIATLAELQPDIGESAPQQTALLGALQETHWTIHRAFCAYQSACEERRQLATEIGETIRPFLDALVSTGWSEEQARNANVQELADEPASWETPR
jgi:hypothetical protein